MQPENTMDQMKHSPLGASGADRWLHCPGSYALLDALKLPPSDEPEWTTHGTAAHDALAYCTEHGHDAWEVIGVKQMNGVEIDLEIANAIQVEIDIRRQQVAEASDSASQIVEYRIAAPDLNRHFYGTVDWALIDGKTMWLADYKHGQGHPVDVENNPQIMYYAFGLLQSCLAEKVEVCNLRITQPRLSWREPVQEWNDVSAESIREWGNNTLVPAMLRAEVDTELSPGHWCKFCPAKIVCPVLTGLFRAAALANPAEIANWSPERLAMSYAHIQGVKSYINALENTAMSIMRRGMLVPGLKLVHKKANRVWKDGAREVMVATYGDEVLSKPTLVGPPAVEKMGREAKALVQEWAYTPTSDLTVALDADPRPAVKVEPLATTFADALTELQKGEGDNKMVDASVMSG